MSNEFNIKNGFISNSDSRVIGGLTATTISATTISARTISATTVSAPTISVTTISATTVSATTISGGTYYGDGTNLTGVVKGSGTANFIPRWTGTTGLGNGIIQDNGSTVSIGNVPNSLYKLYVSSPLASGIYGETSGTNKYGVIGSNIGDFTGTYVGVYGYGSAADTSYVDSIYVGGKFLADGSQAEIPLNYALWLMDGTQGLNKVLISATADGKTNWSSNLTGLTSVSASTLSGGTVSSSGDVTAGGVLKSTQSSGDEGGEVQLATAQTNSSLSGTSVNIDIYRNRIRIFEAGGSNRGAYIDITQANTGVGSDLLNPTVTVTFNYGLANAIMTGTFLT